MTPLQTVSNALDVLTLLGRGEKYLSVDSLADSLGIPDSTVYRLIQTLEMKGFVERHSRNNICLGSKLLSLVQSVQNNFEVDLCIIAAPFLEEVCNLTNETTILSVRTDLYSKCIKSVSSKQIIRFVAEEKRFLPLSIGGSSRAILAYEDPRVIQLVLDTLPAHERPTLLERLGQERAQGYSLSINELDSSALGIGVPVFNANGGIYASIAIVGPDSRLQGGKVSEYAKLLKDVSKKITKSLKERECQGALALSPEIEVKV